MLPKAGVHAGQILMRQAQFKALRDPGRPIPATPKAPQREPVWQQRAAQHLLVREFLQHVDALFEQFVRSPFSSPR